MNVMINEDTFNAVRYTIIGLGAGTVAVSSILTTMGLTKFKYRLKQDGYIHSDEYKSKLKKNSLKLAWVFTLFTIVPGLNIWFANAMFKYGYNDEEYEGLKRVEIADGAAVKMIK